MSRICDEKYSNIQVTITCSDANGFTVSYPITLNDIGLMSWMNNDGSSENPNFGKISFKCSQEVILGFRF